MVVRNVFLQALFMTLLIFGIGLFFGLILESNRSDKAEVVLLNSEIRLLDEQLRLKALNNFNVSCSYAKNNTFEFADEIYYEARNLEKYDSSRNFKDTFQVLHKRYDLLRFLLWSEAIDTQARCGKDFHIVVYLYDYNTEEVKKRAMQNYFSRFLTELKQKYPDKVLLLPMAADMNVSSIDIVASRYKVDKYPAVVFDGSLVLYENDDLKILNDLVNDTNTMKNDSVSRNI